MAAVHTQGHSPGPVDVEIGEASYQVCFNEDGEPWMVRVRAQCRKSSVPYTTSLRRLPIDSAKALTAIAKATRKASQ